MPITMQAPVRRLSQSEFGELAYRHPSVQLEVPIKVWHGCFAKTYYLDALVADGGLFEFKAAESIVPKHRAQTMNYLHLADLGHGKLVNLRPEQVEHEFVNTTWNREDRLQFETVLDRWNDAVPGASRFREVLAMLLHDWGTCLELPLYEEALIHFLDGEAQVLAEVEVRMSSHSLGR